MIDLITIMSALPIRWKNMFAAGFAALLIAAPAFMGSPGFAQPPKLTNFLSADKKESRPEAKVASPEQQQEIAKRALAEAQAERDRTVITPPGISRQEAEGRYLLLDGLITRLTSQLNLIDERKELLNARNAAEQKAKNWNGFSEPPPYSILMVDEMVETVLAARSKKQGFDSSRELLAQQDAHYQDAAKRARVKDLQAAEDLERAPTPEDRLIALWRKELAGIRARNADAMATWVALRHEVLGERSAVARSELDLLERQLAEARRRVVFSRADLNKALARLMSNRSRLEQEMEASLARDTLKTSGLAQAQQQLDAFTARHGKGVSSETIGVLHDELEARQHAALAWVESSRFETEVVSALIYINQSVSTFWEPRYTAVAGKNFEKQRTILAGFRKSRERFKPWLEYAQHQLEGFQAAEREQEARLLRIEEPSPLRTAERDLLAARRLQREVAERLKAALAQVDVQLQSWQEDIEHIQQQRSITERFRNWFDAASDILRQVWYFELFAVEDTVEVAGQKVVTTHGVTVGKSFGSLLLFLLGYGIAAFFSRHVQRIMVGRFGFGKHQASVIRRWLLALTTFILLVITLNLARIPLTVFAFLGGALAIGVGFGTQTIIKNFISGILILLERKVQVGDTVDVDGAVGRITSVDLRASTILGFDGVETVIPNSTFLENKVTNWTHNNSRLRRIMRVGVAYGSPTERVRAVLAECAERHGLVLKDPPPLVFFEDFGDNAMIFALYFWIDYGLEVNPLRVASDLRFMIELRFTEENISVACPQRDVHLDSSQPLRVQVVSSSGPTVFPSQADESQA
jgi:potassium-dependent mechanosensitive channel